MGRSRPTRPTGTPGGGAGGPNHNDHEPRRQGCDPADLSPRRSRDTIRRMTATSLPRLVRSLSKKYGPKTAMTVHAKGECAEFSWCDLWTGAAGVAADLVRKGLPDEATVVIAAPLSAGVVAAEVGVMTARGVACPLDPAMDDAGAEAVLAQAMPWAVFATEEQRKRIGRLCERLSGRCQFFPIPEVHPGRTAQPTLDPAVEARIESTGPGGHAVSIPAGDGGAPHRLVDFLHRTLTGTTAALASALGATEEDIWLAPGRTTTPLDRVAGLYAGLASGGQVALVASTEGPLPDPLEPFWVVRPTIAVLPPGEVAAVAARVRGEARSLTGLGGWLARVALRLDGVLEPGESPLLPRPWWREAARAGRTRLADILGGRLRVVLTGPGGPDPEAARVIGVTGAAMCATHGPPEAAGLVTFQRPGESVPPGSVGRPLDGVRVRVSDEGEVLVQGDNVMLSHRMVRPDQNPLFRDGWLRTGESGTVDAEGWVRLDPGPRKDRPTRTG